MLKGSMLQKRQASYAAPQLVLHGDSGVEGAHKLNRQPSRHDPDAFSDLKLDVRDHQQQQQQQRHHTTRQTKSRVTTSKLPPSGCPRPTAQVGPTSVAIVTAAPHTIAPTLTPSKVQHALRRCHSASAVRKRLQTAVEQSSFTTKMEQAEALRSLGKKQSASPAIGADDRQLYYQYPNQHEPEMVAASNRGDSLSSSTRLVRGASGAPIHPLHRLNRVGSAVQLLSGSPSSSAPSGSFSSLWRRPSSDAPTAGGTPATIVGGYKSSSVQMEVELAERLNEIERSKIHDKPVLRVRACQHVLDAIVQQDELYSRLLCRIRDEFVVFVDAVATAQVLSENSSGSSTAFSGLGCLACGRSSSSSNNNDAVDMSLDFALLQQENTALKKSCNAMQAEIARLRCELRAVRLSTSSSASATPVPTAATNLLDNLDDVQLCVCRSPQRSETRPAGIPQLDLRCISPYDEDEDDEDEEPFPDEFDE